MTRGLFRICSAAAAICALAAPAAFAKPGDVYVVDRQHPNGDGSVIRIGAAGGPAMGLFTTASFTEPTGITMLPDGRLLVTEQIGPTPGVYEVNPGTGAVTPFSLDAQFDAPRDVARGPDGILYVIDSGADAVLALNPATKAVAPYAALPNTTTVHGAVVRRDGTLFLTNRGAPRSVLAVAPGGAVSTIASGGLISDPTGIAISPDEKALYVADIGSGGVIKIDIATGAVSQVSPVPDPHGVALRPDNTLLVTNSQDDLVQRLAIGGGPLSTFSSAAEFDFPDDLVIETPRCGGRRATIVGTNGRDVLRGSRFADVFAGLGGKDVLSGLQGKDVICGGAGRDILRGGAGNDRLIGGKGNDRLIGGKGKRDRTKGGPGKDVERP